MGNFFSRNSVDQNHNNGTDDCDKTKLDNYNSVFSTINSNSSRHSNIYDSFQDFRGDDETKEEDYEYSYTENQYFDESYDEEDYDKDHNQDDENGNYHNSNRFDENLIRYSRIDGYYQSNTYNGNTYNYQVEENDEYADQESEDDYDEYWSDDENDYENELNDDYYESSSIDDRRKDYDYDSNQDDESDEYDYNNEMERDKYLNKKYDDDDQYDEYNNVEDVEMDSEYSYDEYSYDEWDSYDSEDESYFSSDDDQYNVKWSSNNYRIDNASTNQNMKKSKPIKIERNDNILIDILKCFLETTDIDYINLIRSGRVYKRKNLPLADIEYSSIKRKFDECMRSGTTFMCQHYRISKVEKIVCPYLLAHFKIKEKKKVNADGVVFLEDVYHGTAKTNISSICKNNFDWRKCGSYRGTKFGQGVSFAKYATYSTFYPKVEEKPKAMFVTRILYRRKQYGNSTMVVPDKGFDATTNRKGNVIVKFDDAEFCPLYIIYYC